MHNVCRLCGSNDLTVCLTLENAPRNIQRLLTPEQIAEDRAMTLRVYQCAECGFAQLVQTLAEDYYADYLMAVSHSPQMNAYQNEQATDFVTRFNLRGARVIELGCGDGNYLHYLQNAGAIVCGIEPSRRFQAAARARGFSVIEGYVGRATPIPGAPYAAFVTRQVLEHVPDPNDFLQGARRLLAPDGVGLIEVPSLEQAFTGARFYDFFADHLNYFSARTLRYALERNCLEVLEIARGMNGEYNVVYVRNTRGDDWASLQQTADDIARAIGEFVHTYYARGKRVAAWGAGGKGITVLATAHGAGIAYVVDADPNKQGRFTPVSHLPIVAPEHLQTDPVDALILTALAHRDEILAQLRDELGYRGTIAILGPRLEIVQQGAE